MKKAKRKCQNGTKTIVVPVHLHTFVSRVGEKLGLNNYEVIERMAQSFAPLFCPELLKLIVKEK
jgi:predicted metallopeptidase